MPFPLISFRNTTPHNSSSFLNLLKRDKLDVPSYVKDPAFNSWFDSLPENNRKIPTRGVFFRQNPIQSKLLPYYEKEFNNFKIQSGLEAERRTQANLESRGLVYNSPFFPRGFNAQKFLINNPVRYNNNTSEAGQRNRFNFRSA